ncbi:MAG: class I fructose-bisphosphate aldolase, partial [Candidatus Paceibacterota bacterium]
MNNESLYKTASLLMTPSKGILAADQSAKTMDRQLEAIGATPEAETRRQYRQLLFTAPGIEKYVTGIILFDATIRNHTDDGTAFVDYLIAKGIIPIIKVDKSTIPLDGFEGEVVTEGLDGLGERLGEYYKMGARAAKWRAVIKIGEGLPSTDAIKLNCLLLARYARLCQEAGIVPIVEPEVLYEGAHDLVRAEEVTTLTLRTLFAVLIQYRVDLKAVILKTSMVLAGNKNTAQSSPEEVAEATLRTLDKSVPSEVPGVVFLSGGQTPEQVTANFNAIAKMERATEGMPPHPSSDNPQDAESNSRMGSGGLPWQLGFSFSRGIEQPV